MGKVVAFRSFKFNRGQMANDVELILCPEEERYVEFRQGERFAMDSGRKYIRTNGGCRFWGIADDSR